MKQQLFAWTGGHPEGVGGCGELLAALPVLPPPAPLLRSAIIVYDWGESKFEVISTACSIRATAWGSEQMTWLHCRAMQTKLVQSGESNGLINCLIPAQYVTHITPGPTFRITGREQSEDLAVFPPNQPAPTNALPRSEVERLIAELLTPERN